MSCSFQSQLVSIMEVLAKAAVAEINKRVDDSCAVLRLEMSQSQRDIDVLKKRCQTMEIELRKTRGRARRKVFYPMASERFPHPVKIVFNKERTSLLRDGEIAVEGDSLLTSAKSADAEQSAVKESILIKVETAEEDVWITDPPLELRISGVVSGAKTGPSVSFGQQHCDEDCNPRPVQAEDSMERYLSVDAPDDPVTLLPPMETSEVLTGQLRPREGDDGGLELVVKDEDEEEEEPDQSAGLDASDQFVMDEAEKHLWSSNPGTDPGDPVFSYTTEQYSQNLSIFPSHGGLSMTEDPGPSIHSIGNPQANLNAHTAAAAAAHVKRHSRTSRDEPRQQTVHIPDDRSNDRMNSMDDNSLALQPRQHQYRATETTMRVSECMTGSTLATSTSTSTSTSSSTFSGYSLSRSSFNIAKRMRSQWRTGVGERRFNCTFCGKSFMRFSQLKEHLRSHTGEKPYTCEQCGRSFTKQCNLIRHAVVHSGEKPYECMQCGKCFTQRSSLKSHQRTHEGESVPVSIHTAAAAFPVDPHTSLMLSQARCFK